MRSLFLKFDWLVYFLSDDVNYKSRDTHAGGFVLTQTAEYYVTSLRQCNYRSIKTDFSSN